MESRIAAYLRKERRMPFDRARLILPIKVSEVEVAISQATKASGAALPAGNYEYRIVLYSIPPHRRYLRVSNAFGPRETVTVDGTESVRLWVGTEFQKEQDVEYGVYICRREIGGDEWAIVHHHPFVIAGANDISFTDPSSHQLILLPSEK